MGTELDHHNLHEILPFEPSSERLAQFLAGWFIQNVHPRPPAAWSPSASARPGAAGPGSMWRGSERAGADHGQAVGERRRVLADRRGVLRRQTPTFQGEGPSWAPGPVYPPVPVQPDLRAVRHEVHLGLVPVRPAQGVDEAVRGGPGGLGRVLAGRAGRNHRRRAADPAAEPDGARPGAAGRRKRVEFETNGTIAPTRRC